MDKLFVKETRQIEICDVDYKGQYRLCHMFNRFAEVATQGAVQLGMWNQDMYDRYGWVVAKQTLKLTQPIRYKDTIEIVTTVGKGTFVTFPRYYFIKKDGEVIGECSSIWTLIDLKNRRIVPLKRVGIDIPEITHDICLELPQTIQIDLPMNYICQRQVLYSDVDINQHMNNTRYIQWAFDIIDYHVHENDYVSEISINYKKEIRPLEYVDLYLGYDGKRYIVEGKNKEDIFFTIEILFTEL